MEWRAWLCLLRGAPRAQLLAQVSRLLDEAAGLRLTLWAREADLMEAGRRIRYLRGELTRWVAGVQQLSEQLHSSEREHSEALAAVQARLEGARYVIDQQLLIEPGVGECTKTRLHTQVEAQAFADMLISRGVYQLGEVETYQCDVCLRHPATTQRFWHIASVGKGTGQEVRAKNKRRFRKARRDGLLIEQRADVPAWMLEMRRQALAGDDSDA